MPESTTATQDEKKPLSLVDHLRHLLADVTAQHTSALHQVQGWKERRRKSPSEINGAQVATWEGTIKWTAEKAEALEQTIAILSVLEHPDFWRIVREYTGKGFIVGAVMKHAYESADIPWADSPIAALLAAHAALKPQEGAGESKGGPADA